MSRQSSWSPLSLLLAGLVVIIILVAGPDTSTRAVQSSRETYPAPALTQTAAASQTAAAGSPSAYPGPGTASPTATRASGTITPTAKVTQTAKPLASATATSVIFPTEITLPTPASEEPEATSTPAPTATPVSELTCAPGVPLEISGEGPPRAPFLLYFGQRAVSGGSVEPDGRFVIALIVGSERAGTYTVTVRVRGTSHVLRELTCSVPAVTPTPLPRRRLP